MSATKTLAFVLKTQDYRDTSLLAHFYTRDFGKVQGIVRGIRDGRERFGSTLEPFSLNEILFYRRRKGSDLHLVTQVDLVDLFLPVREDLERLSHASYMVDLVDSLVEAEEPCPEIFDLLNDTFGLMGNGISSKRAARIFELKLLEILGFAPETQRCVMCQTEMPEPAYFNISLGGIHCKNCTQRGSGFPVSRGTMQFLGHVARRATKDLQNVKVAQEVGEELEKILRRFVDFHLSNKLKSVVFLEKMGYN